MSTDGLPEFLLARVAEDEEVASAWPEELSPPPDGHAFWRDANGHLIYQPRSRMLDECAAKRAVLAIHCRNPGRDPVYPDHCEGCDYEGDWGVPTTEDINKCPVLRAIALPYRRHPGYRAEWAPGE